jgi:hypothetical protein
MFPLSHVGHAFFISTELWLYMLQAMLILSHSCLGNVGMVKVVRKACGTQYTRYDFFLIRSNCLINRLYGLETV